jgi:dienelactone hydrolase
VFDSFPRFSNLRFHFKMSLVRSTIVAGALSAAVASVASAGIPQTDLQFNFSGIASGTLGGVAFSSRAFTFTGFGNTQNRAAFNNALFVGYSIAHTTTDFSIIMKLVGEARNDQVMGDVGTTLDWLGKAAFVNAKRLAITCFCWGGSVTWMAAGKFPQLKAGGAWYGRIKGSPSSTEARQYPIDLAASLKAPVLGLYGALDKGIPVADVEAMQAALVAGKANPASANHKPADVLSTRKTEVENERFMPYIETPVSRSQAAGPLGALRICLRRTGPQPSPMHLRHLLPSVVPQLLWLALFAGRLTAAETGWSPENFGPRSVPVNSDD